SSADVARDREPLRARVSRGARYLRRMRVAIVSGPRSATPMGLELAEQRLLDALRAADTPIQLDLRVVGGRAARAYARRLHGRWIPAPPGHPWAAAWRRADL